MNGLQQFVFKRTYAKWNDEEQRREELSETVDRYCDFIDSERDVPAEILGRIRSHMNELGVMPSMRALWSAGKAARNDNTMIYNCAFVPIDSIVSFAEALYILMMGTGVGYSVEREFVNNLPTIAEYSAMRDAMPDIDYSRLVEYEVEYNGTGAKELACVGGACELSL